MDGLTPVPTVNKYLRVNSLKARFGDGDINIGDITATADISGSLQVHCEAGSTGDEGCHFTVPLGKSLIPITLSLEGGKSTPGRFYFPMSIRRKNRNVPGCVVE